MLGADLVPPCHLRNNCARGKGFRNDPALLRLGPATPTPNTCPDFYSAARPRSVKYIVDHICEPIPSNRSTSADLSKPPQGAVRRPLTLERAQGYLKLPNGRALTGQSHDYKRHGTTTLFAALEVATGKIIAAHSKRRRRIEFLDFMNSVTAAFPNRKLHVILDNLNTHKKNEHWLKAHPNVQFHFTPTSASWLNQVELWFSILQGQSLSGASFTSLKQLQEHIDAYIKAYNDSAEPFAWTKKKVRQRRFKGRRITQL
jgi:transposase